MNKVNVKKELTTTRMDWSPKLMVKMLFLYYHVGPDWDFINKTLKTNAKMAAVKWYQVIEQQWKSIMVEYFSTNPEDTIFQQKEYDDFLRKGLPNECPILESTPKQFQFKGKNPQYWTQQTDKLLFKYFEEFGTRWVRICQQMPEKPSYKEAKVRYNLLVIWERAHRAYHERNAMHLSKEQAEALEEKRQHSLREKVKLHLYYIYTRFPPVKAEIKLEGKSKQEAMKQQLISQMHTEISHLAKKTGSD